MGEPAMDYDAIFRSIGQLVREVRTPGFSDSFQEFLISLFDPQSVIVLVFENRRRPRQICGWIPDDALRTVFEQSYFDYGYFLDPFYELAMSEFEDGTFRLREIAPDRFFRTEYCRRYFKQTRMVDELGCLARIDDSRVAHLSMGRNEGAATFKKKDQAVLTRLAPALMPLIVEHCGHMIRRGAVTTPRRPRRSLKERLVYTKLAGGKRITEREAEVASLVVQGHSTSAIGLILDISPQTVKVHRRNIYRKLNISSQTELFAQFVS